MHPLFYDNSLVAQKEKRVLKQIYQYHSISRPELLTINNYKTATLYRTIDSLISKKLVISSKSDESRNVGRRSDIIMVNNSFGYVYAILVTRSVFVLSIIDFSNNIIDKRIFEMNENISPEKFIDICYTSYWELLKEHQLNVENVIGIAISTVGPIDIARGTIKEIYNFKGTNWSGYNIVDGFSKRFGKKVMFNNNARSAVVGKYIYEYIRHYNNLSYIIIEEGIGSGLITNKQIVKGTNRSINGIGHMRVDIGGRKCYCGNYGCVEAYTSADSILTSVVRELKIGKTSMLADKKDSLTFSDICNAVRNNDKLAINIIENAAYIFIIGLENFLNIVDLEIVFLGGMLIEKCNFFFQLVQEQINKIFPSIIIKKDENFQDTCLKGIASLLILDMLDDSGN